MILDSSKPASKRLWWSVVTTALIIGWAGFALTGSTDVQAGQESDEADVYRAHFVKVDESAEPQKKVAYFIALAMESVDGLLDEYPDADLDEDGELTVEETLTLFKAENMRLWSETAAAIERRLVEKQLANEKPVEGTLRFEAKPAEGELRPVREEPVEGTLRIRDRSSSAPSRRRVAGPRIALNRRLLTSGVFRWLLDNKTQEPDADAVAEYAEIVAEIRLTKYLEFHPEADADGDGTLTAEERDEYSQLLRSFKESKAKFGRLRRISSRRRPVETNRLSDPSAK